MTENDYKDELLTLSELASYLKLSEKNVLMILVVLKKYGIGMDWI